MQAATSVAFLASVPELGVQLERPGRCGSAARALSAGALNLAAAALKSSLLPWHAAAAVLLRALERHEADQASWAWPGQGWAGLGLR